MFWRCLFSWLWSYLWAHVHSSPESYSNIHVLVEAEKAEMYLAGMVRRRMGGTLPWKRWVTVRLKMPLGTRQIGEAGKDQAEEWVVTVMRTEKSNRDFSTACMPFDTIKWTFISIFWRLILSSVRHRAEGHWSRMGTNAGRGLVRDTVSCSGTPQSSWKAVNAWKKDFLKHKPTRNLLRLEKEGTETKLRPDSSLQFSWNKKILRKKNPVCSLRALLPVFGFS